MPSETEPAPEIPRPPAHQRGTDAGDLILAALDFVGGGLPGNRETPRPPSLAGQEARHLQCADGLGLLLNLGREDNLGVFDAHDKNLVRAGKVLIPFDVIPCHPAGGFLVFIQETLAAGHSLRAVRTVTTARS